MVSVRDCQRCKHLLASTAPVSNIDGQKHRAWRPGADRPWIPCPNRTGSTPVGFDGYLTPVMCGANTCPVCGPWKARRLADAVHLVRPLTFFTIHEVGGSWPEIGRNMTAFRRLFRGRERMDAEFAYFVEPNRRGEQHHVHGFAWGEVHDYTRYSDSALASGMADVHIDVIRHHGNLGYGVKAMFDDDERDRFLDANGGRLVHASKGFWRGPDGSPVAGGYLSVPAAYGTAPLADGVAA